MFKCRCSHTAAQMGKHIDVFTSEFFHDDENIWPCLKSFLSLSLYSPSLHSLLSLLSVSLVARQQSLEWSSHPCKGVSTWLCVCECACDCVRGEPSTLTPILGGGFQCESDSGQGDGISRPHLKEQNPTQALCNTRKQQENKRLRGNPLFRLCTPWCFYRRMATPTSWLSTDTGSVFILERIHFLPWVIVDLFSFFLCNS